VNARRCRVLFVDDSSDDQTLFRTALHRSGALIEVLPPVYDGAQAIAYLAGLGEYADRDRYPLPDLFVLDLKMPCTSGHDVLTWLQKASNRPVTVVLSGSDRDEDISKADTLGAWKYFVKPNDWAEWVSVVRQIGEQCTSSPIAPNKDTAASAPESSPSMQSKRRADDTKRG
jgi:CheY-like chemotaxis protein